MSYNPHASDKIGYSDWPQSLKDEFKRWHWELLDRDLEKEPWNIDARLFRRANVMNARGKNNNTTQNQPPNRGNTSSPGAYAQNMSAAPPSPSISTATTTNNQAHLNNQGAKKVPIFFREEYATLIVKGNFMTLAAQPHQVEIGEWLAHQLVEQNRILSGMLKVMQECDRTTGKPTCSEQTCPAMTAGPTTYSWIDVNRNPINLPAPIYIKHIQTWVNGKIQDPKLFPTEHFTTAPPLPPTPEVAAADPDNNWRGKASGFPARFDAEIKNMYKQMFRCYAHLYWQHWIQFWELNMNRELNTCFVHFVNVGRIFGLLNEKDMEPMAPLVEVWVKQGVLPKTKVETEAAGAASKEASGGTAPRSAGGEGGGGGGGGAGGAPGASGAAS